MVGQRSSKRSLSAIPHVRTAGIVARPSIRRPKSSISVERIAAMAALIARRRPPYRERASAKGAPNRSPISRRYSIAAAVPAIPSWFCVPVSHRSSAGRTLNAGSDARSARFP
jgi:hypothetical protein